MSISRWRSCRSWLLSNPSGLRRLESLLRPPPLPAGLRAHRGGGSRPSIMKKGPVHHRAFSFQMGSSSWPPHSSPRAKHWRGSSVATAYRTSAGGLARGADRWGHRIDRRLSLLTPSINFYFWLRTVRGTSSRSLVQEGHSAKNSSKSKDLVLPIGHGAVTEIRL